MGGRWRPKKWVVVLLGSIGAFVGLVAVVGFWTGVGPYDLPPKSRQLEEVMAVSKSLGLPMTQEELVGPKPPDDQNAAIDVLSAIERIQPLQPAELAAVARGVYTDSPGAKKAVLDQTNTLDAVVNAVATKPNWHIERDYDAWLMLDFQEYSKIKDAAKVLAARGVLHARDGRTVSAIRDITTIRTLAASLASEPVLISLLVATALDSIAHSFFRLLANEWAHDSLRLSALARAIEESHPIIDPRPALRGEFYASLAYMRNFKQFGGFKGLTRIADGESLEVDRSKLVRSGVPKGLFARASMSKIAEVWNDVFQRAKLAEDPYRSWGPILDAHSAKFESRFRASEIMALIMFPVFTKACDALLNMDVQQDLAVALVKCLRYRATNKAWPKDLKAINADAPDPFSPGSSIQVRFEKDALCVWSVGRDRIDNGGEQKEAGSSGSDTAFNWPPKFQPVPSS